MIVSNTESVPGHKITQVLGVARGSTVRGRNVGRDIMAGIRNLVGGEIGEYTKLQAQAREQAMQRLTADAQRLGADAVVCLRFNTSMIMDGAAEILVYGTAVKISPVAG
ncbi:YbjQ family protein [Candidatus Saccharibacteria bacterium]|nr:YbjQ family protein [Candidatus Saccharibacteria bacterium]